ncbi:hypothetical protein [Streptomyces sp. NPDC021012]|uniref:hypothetical protein n=1 Tax=unclassified Streptomyces TaxID=2593676 RepID=UPI0037937488
MLRGQEVPGATAALKHDFALTEHHAVFGESPTVDDAFLGRDLGSASTGQPVSRRPGRR